ncbi:MAG TPA: DUF6335 family protein [Thermoanaerobaculia bacterium]
MAKTDRPQDSETREVPDLNKNGIDDEIEPPAPDIEAGSRQLLKRFRLNPGASPTLAGGDLDARWEDAESSGDEAVAGTNSTPGDNDLDAQGRALGITYADDEELRPGFKEAARDERRWELDPASSEDFTERDKDR